jgi:hypothetical protein
MIFVFIFIKKELWHTLYFTFSYLIWVGWVCKYMTSDLIKRPEHNFVFPELSCAIWMLFTCWMAQDNSGTSICPISVSTVGLKIWNNDNTTQHDFAFWKKKRFFLILVRWVQICYIIWEFSSKIMFLNFKKSFQSLESEFSLSWKFPGISYFTVLR